MQNLWMASLVIEFKGHWCLPGNREVYLVSVFQHSRQPVAVVVEVMAISFLHSRRKGMIFLPQERKYPNP